MVLSKCACHMQESWRKDHDTTTPKPHSDGSAAAAFYSDRKHELSVDMMDMDLDETTK